MGPSGSGKTTLLHVLAGLITPDSGDVEVAGLDLVSASARARARHRRERVSMVFQFGELLPELNVAENVSLPLRLIGERPDGRRVQDALDAVGLRDPGAWPAQLSGGETQRAAVARALVTRPAVLLCDEPTGSLDAASSEQVVRLLLESAHQSAATLIVSTHDPAVAARMDETWLLNDGSLRSLRCR
jgi:ABC-type lipoprotein export system ATPase subunit